MRWNGIAVINKPVSALLCESTVCCQGCRSSDFQRAKVSCSKSFRLSCPQQSKQPIPTSREQVPDQLGMRPMTREPWLRYALDSDEDGG